MKKLIVLCLAIAGFTSCSDVEGVTYNPNSTYLGFEKNTYDLPVNINSSSTVEVKLVASNKSNTDRTYNLSVVSEESNADVSNYSVPATITIPANSFEGIAVITGVDNDDLDFVPKKLVIELDGLNTSESTDTQKITLNLFEVCPLVISDFVGTFDAVSWYNGTSIHEVSVGTAEKTLQIENFFELNTASPNFVIKYDANNVVTFAEQSTGEYSTVNGGFIWARMSTVPANVSKIDPCTNKITVWVNYYIPNVGSYGDKQEVFTKQ